MIALINAPVGFEVVAYNTNSDGSMTVSFDFGEIETDASGAETLKVLAENELTLTSKEVGEVMAIVPVPNQTVGEALQVDVLAAVEARATVPAPVVQATMA